MTILSIICIIYIYFFAKNYKKAGLRALLVIPISLFFLTLFIMEFSLGNSDFFISDEMLYIEEVTNGSFWGEIDRFLWYFLNYIIVNYDIYMNGLSLKLINIPIAAGFMLLLWKVFDSNKLVSYLPIFVPYFCYVCIFNFRDIAIWFFTLLTIYCLFKDSIKQKLFGFVCLAMLFLLRPFAAMIVLFLVLLTYLWFSLKGVQKKRNLKALGVILLIVLTFGTYFYPVVEQKMTSYINWFQYTTGEGQEQHISSMNVDFATGNRLKDLAISSVAYVATPFPHSILIRLLNGGSQQWGVIDDFIRFCNQLIYYCLLIYLFCNLKYFKPVLKRLNKTQAVVMIAFLSYWPIYSFHLYGAVHQRLKIPFQIVIFLLAILIYQNKHSLKRLVR